MPQRQRTVITTDPELDDLNSMLRLLLHGNEIDLEALVVTSSRFHWSGDADLAGHRWVPEGAKLHIEQALEAYAAAYPNLVVHDPAYPAPEALRAVHAIGNIRSLGDTSAPTEGSRLIERAILSDDPRILFVQHWGGFNTTARALMSIEERFADDADWPERKAAITAKLVLSSFAEQDETYADYIRPNWPGLEFREVMTAGWGYFARTVVDEEGAGFLTAGWMREHVSSVGPVGAAYRVWGDGLQMAPGDTEDYFGERDATKEELEARGFWVWAPLQEAGAWISEGDTSNFTPLIPNGLRAHEHATFGGWGGRLRPSATEPGRYEKADAPELRADGTAYDGWSVGRWLPDFQRELAGRLRWTVAPTFAEANHPPVVEPIGPVDLTVPAGGSVQLAVSATDPDGDALAAEWWQYREAGTLDAGLVIDATDAPGIADAIELRATVAIPADAPSGATAHVVVTVRDGGEPSFTRYARFILTVA